jgi:undecaprenyl-diphosphatase
VRELVRSFDERVDAAFDRLRGDQLADRIFYGASSLGDFGLIWVLLAAARGLRGGPRHERAAVRGIVAAPLESLVVNVGVKSLFRRVRPRRHDPHPHRFRQPLTSSFPSGHATAAFCAFVLLSEGDELWPLYLAAAGVVAASRVYVKIHHPSDVAAGMAIGAGLGLLGRRLAPLPRRTPMSY